MKVIIKQTSGSLSGSEQVLEKPIHDGIAKILDPSTGLVNARIILRTAPPTTEQGQAGKAG